ncbi:ATP-binding cassette, subfamily B [Pseudobutyrivibrio sp. NOR37]|uniref:ABC transporter ATP-binding protein n=1 Tax=Pseudobutyrivibrio xylanivorans TaxID=185007 RepID=A0A6M0LDP7_PSEXY|nr:MULTISPECIES: ABC transporter ATP-binding protein [Pseudobutyrivibrio]NEX00674.1 ABC transporter ATP-binding protein [Pseudobutyrivibrio xylanivorans]SFR61963.1 ATP-binding cassette, subfamily B [Pseudobutyrivibrio sp. NOR37]
MLKILHRIVAMTGIYSSRIRASYITSFIKGVMMKIPLILSFFAISFFMEGTMDKSKCLYLGIGIVASIVLEAVFEHITNVLQSATGYMVFADMRMRLGDHLRKLPMGYFTEGNIGKISAVLATDMVFIEENCMGVLSELVSFIISQGIMIVMMFVMDFRLGLLSVLIVGAFIVVGNLMLKTTLKHSVIKQEGAESLTEEVLDFAEGIGIIKSFNMLGDKSKRLSDEFEKSCRESIHFEIAYGPWARMLYLTFGIGTSLMLVLSGILYSGGELSSLYMIGMVLFLFDLFVSIKSYYGQMARLTVTNASLDRIEEVFAAEELKDSGKETLSDKVKVQDEEAEIEYKGVNFGYTQKDVLKNVSFKVKKGEMTALVGPSGGGKSTIASLLARFWDIKEGSISVRGKDIKNVSLGSLMDQISMVFQRVYLFQDTVYNNIAIGRPDATKEEVMEAAKKARCYDFIMELPEGFDTVIGEGGASLSGGEKQRISIARCILKDSPIVILDEATASVDADNERAIQEAISELCKDKTLLVIAHRLKTIKDADQILVVSDGEIIERGNHDSLIQQDGVYTRMVSLQA